MAGRNKERPGVRLTRNGRSLCMYAVPLFLSLALRRPHARSKQEGTL